MLGSGNMAAPLRLLSAAGKLSGFQLKSKELCSVALQRGHLSISLLQLQTLDSDLKQKRTYSSFINQRTAKELWDGVYGVSNAGKKSGRQKRRRGTDLNRGQVVGTGKANIQWPGLNQPIIKGREVMTRKQLPPNPEREKELAEMRDAMKHVLRRRLAPLERGFTGNRFPGQSVGRPDPIGDYAFEGFDSRVLLFRLVSNMTGTLGRIQRFNAMVVVGNGNGIAGYAAARAVNGRTAIRVAKNKAAQNLFYVPRFEDRTVYHNMYTRLHKTSIFIHRREEGYGVCSHRVLKAICNVMGIKDVHCKVEGSSKNVIALTRAFFNALSHQETHQELADRTGYHVVEFRKARDDLPVVVASPSGGSVKDEKYENEIEDIEVNYDRIYFGGKVEYIPPKHQYFYEKLKLPGWRKHVSENHKVRNQRKALLQRQLGYW